MPIPVASRSLTRRSVAARLLEFRVQTPQAAWMSVSCEYCVFCQVKVSATGRLLVQTEVLGSLLCLSAILKPQQRDVLGTQSAFLFFLQSLFQIFLILQRTERDIIINILRSSCEVQVILVRF
jgi:hypothetical protein